MGYEFSFGWAFGGLAIMIAATIFLRFHQWVADNFGAGVADYEHYKLYALIAIGVGFLIMINLVPLLLSMVAHTLFGGAGGATDAPPVIEE